MDIDELGPLPGECVMPKNTPPESETQKSKNDSIQQDGQKMDSSLDSTDTSIQSSSNSDKKYVY